MSGNLKTVVEISECFPNKFKPVTGEFILQHVKALSEYYNVITLVPLRYLPSRELLSFNPVKLFVNLREWFSSLSKTKNFTTGNLSIIYFGYLSLPRPYFEAIENKIVKFFFLNKVKRLLKGTKPDLIYCNWIRPWTELSKQLADDFNIPFVIDHHEDIPTLKKLFPDKYKYFLKSFEIADRIIVHSSVNREQLLNENLILNKVTVNYYGQNFTVDNKVKVFNFTKVKLICVSHLYERRKNVDILIEALSLIKDRIEFELHIIGEGSLRTELSELSDKLNLKEKIFFEGSKSQNEINAFLSESDIFILPSFPEAFGVVFIEALANGVPVITCEGNGGGEELKNLGYPAVLIKPGSPEQLSKAILELSENKERMLTMSERGKDIVNKYFTWDKNALRTNEILNETIKNF